MSDLEPRDGMSDLERRLAGWRPSAGGLDRDRTLFEAGRASASPVSSRSGAGPWRLATAALAVVALGLGGELARQRQGRLRAEVALAAALAPDPDPGPTPTPAPSPDAGPAPDAAPSPVRLASLPEPDSYLSLTRRALADGLGSPGPARANPEESPGSSRPPLRVRDRLEL